MGPFYIVIGIVIIALCAFATVLCVIGLKKNKSGENVKKSPLAITAEALKAHVTVIGMNCRVSSVGHKMPKTVKEFSVYFKNDAGEEFSVPVDEEIYDAFEEGQTGEITLIDGRLDSFVLDGSEENE